MKFYSIADVIVGLDPQYPMLRERCKPYLCRKSGVADYIISLENDSFAEWVADHPETTAEVLEYLRVGTLFYSVLVGHHGLMLHASAVVVDGACYAFSADSGVGKSTHTALWLKAFADQGAYILNDDKPAIKLENGSFVAWGTPFSGAQDVSVNRSVPLKAIAFVERSQTNSIERLTAMRAIPRLLRQTVRPADEKQMNLLLDTVQELVKKVPLYLLRCNREPEAALMAYEAMSK